MHACRYMGAGRPRIFLAFLRSRFILIIFGNDEDVILELDLSFTELYGRMALEFLMRSNTCHNCVSLCSVRIESNPRTSLLRYKIPFVKKNVRLESLGFFYILITSNQMSIYGLSFRAFLATIKGIFIYP